MLILLPPSEGKVSPERGNAVDLDSLNHPSLSGARREVLGHLIAVSALPDAATRLKVSAGLATQVAQNTTLLHAPAGLASEVYTGVLYHAASLATLRGPARRRASGSVRIVSALWGVLTPTDRIPAYRLSILAPLQPLAPLASFWAPHLAAALPLKPAEVVLDCRSGAYLPAWTPPPHSTWLTVRVVAIRHGRPVVVSHHAKHTRGLLTGHLLQRESPLPRTARGVVEAAGELVGTVLKDVRLHPPARKGPGVLELVLR